MTLTFTREDLQFWIIKYLWILILLPKMVQFAVYSLILVLLLLKKPLHPNRGVFFFILGAAVQIIAIIWQCLIKDPALSRVAAGINTSLIWIISALFYSVFAGESLSPDAMKKYHDCCVRNLVIMFLIYLFSLVSPANTFNVLGHTIYLRRMDYLSSGTTSRFAGMTETVLGPSHFYAFTLPVLFFGRHSGNDLRDVILAFLGFVCVFATHSRMGTICCFGMLYLYVRQFLCNRYGKSITTLLDIITALTVFIAAIVFWDRIADVFISFFNARGGSNEARFTIYRKSLAAFWNENPLFGCGVKNMIDMGNGYSFPYGSHSMYVGLLYKTGIVGTLFYTIGFIDIFIGLHSSLRSNRNCMSIILIFVCYFVMLIFADLDASDWVIVSMFSTWGILSNSSAVHSYDQRTALEKVSHAERNGYVII